MVSATSGTETSTGVGIVLSTTTPSVSSSSFTQQLAGVLEQYLGKAGNQSGLEIDIQPDQSQNSGSSQFLVTVKTMSAVLASAPAGATPSAPPSDSLPGNGSAGLPGVTAADSTPSSSGNPSSSYTEGGLGGAPPPGYVNIPFGNSFSTVPTLDNEIAAANKSTSIMARINPDSITNGMASAEPGDPMKGQTVSGGTMKWDDLTQDQQLAYQYAMLCGLPPGQSMDQFLSSYAGPKAWWNASYNNPDMFGTPPAAGSVTAYQTPYIDPSA